MTQPGPLVSERAASPRAIPEGGSTARHAAEPCLPDPGLGAPSWLMVMAMRAAEQHVLVVIGEADLHTAGQLRTELMAMLAVEPPSVLIELGALEFCDLSGLDALHDVARAGHDAGVEVTFRGMSPWLSRLHSTFPPHRPGP